MFQSRAINKPYQCEESFELVQSTYKTSSWTDIETCGDNVNVMELKLIIPPSCEAP